eukprot:scaffold11834_cov69-Phaeocystis_antarctica.AAC.3
MQWRMCQLGDHARPPTTPTLSRARVSWRAALSRGVVENLSTRESGADRKVDVTLRELRQLGALWRRAVRRSPARECRSLALNSIARFRRRR